MGKLSATPSTLRDAQKAERESGRKSIKKGSVRTGRRWITPVAIFSACVDEFSPFPLRSSSLTFAPDLCRILGFLCVTTVPNLVRHLTPLFFPLPVVRFGSTHRCTTMETATTIVVARRIRFEAQNERLVCIREFLHKYQPKRTAGCGGEQSADFERKF